MLDFSAKAANALLDVEVFVHIKDKGDVEYDENAQKTDKRQVTWLYPVRLGFERNSMKLRVSGHILRRAPNGTVTGRVSVTENLPLNAPSSSDEDDEDDEDEAKSDDGDGHVQPRRSARLASK